MAVTLAAALVAALLGGCATQAERAAAAEREIDDMIKVYGPACEKLGYTNGTDPWRGCVLRLADRDSAERSRRQGTFTNCIGTHGFFQCNTF
ncbi:MAG: hypothetical protein JSS46_14500 [Proteobacteria bacterium]|nr:hypothetical protein [Pseudomonadota bacterium]